MSRLKFEPKEQREFSKTRSQGYAGTRLSYFSKVIRPLWLIKVLKFPILTITRQFATALTKSTFPSFVYPPLWQISARQGA